MLVAAALAITPAVGTDPVKASRLMPGCAVSGAPASAPVPWTTLNTPAGTPASCMMSASRLAVRGAHSGGFDDHGVAGREGRADPPAGQHQRRVPRSDDGDDTGGVVADPLAVPAARDLHVGVAELVLGEVGEGSEVHRHPRHHATAMAAEQGAVVTGLDDGEVLDPCLDAVGDGAQDVAALLDRERGPRREGCPSRGDSGVHLGRRAGVDLGERLLVDRRDVGEGGARRDPLAADPVTGVDLDALDDRVGAAHRAVSCCGVRVARLLPPSQTTPTWR